MPTSARALPSINTSGLRNASASSSRSARDQPPLTAVYAAASAAYYDRPRSPYPSVDSYETPTHQDNPYSTRLQESGYDSLSRAEGRASYEDRQLYTLGESDLPYDQPDDQPVASGSNSRAMPTPATALVYDPDYVIAMHDFAPETPTATCLSFRAGEVIHVLNRDATGWWDGELDGRRGWFPSNYVSTDAAAFAAAAELAGFTVAHVESTSEWTSKGRHLTVTPQNPGESSRAPSKSPTRKSRSRPSETHPRRPSAGLDSSEMSESILDRRASCPPLMVPMVHALALLQTAVRANRVTHFQPSTACIISCVRSVLSTCDCLNKDSPYLSQYPTLAHQRKKVLAELARLVGQARQASESAQSKLAAVDPEAKRAQLMDPERQKELLEMVRLGDLVYQHVKKFLGLAVSCGIELPQDRVFAGAPGLGESSTPEPSQGTPALGATATPMAPQMNRSITSGPVPDPSTARRGHTRRSSSMSDLRKQRADEAPSLATHPDSPGGSADEGEAHSPTSATSSQGTDTPSVASASDAPSSTRSDWLPRERESSSSTYRARHPGELRRQKSLTNDRPGARRSVEFHPIVASSHQSTPPSSTRRQSFGNRGLTVQLPYHRTPPARQAAAPYRKPKYSISSVSSLSSYESSQLDSGSSASDTQSVFPSGPTSTLQALATLRLTHDRLLSVIAAFIGHIHSHSRSSHASSKGHLIEMTRKTVDQVRYLLTLVDAVEEHEGICEVKPREMAMLKMARVALYNSTNDIVEGVKDMMSPPEGGLVTEEEEKARALQAATGTLRAGGDCVKTVNMCLSAKIGEEPFVINIASVPGSEAETTQEQNTPPSAPSTGVSTSPPRTPKSPTVFRRTHAHSMSHPHPHAGHASRHSYSSSTGGSISSRKRRPQSDISPIRGEGPARRRAEMIDGVPESLHEDSPEEGEETVRLPVVDEPVSTMAVAGHEDVSNVVDESLESAQILRASIGLALPVLVVSDASSLPPELPSSQGSDSTTLSRLSISNGDSGSPRTSMDTAETVYSKAQPTYESDAASVVTETEYGQGDARLNATDDSPEPVHPGSEAAQSEHLGISDMLGGEELQRVVSSTSTLEEKLIHGDLPATPSAPPEFVDAVYDPRDLLVNDAQQLVAASLEVMAIKMAPLSSTPDRSFVLAFLLTFRLFTSPSQFATILINRWNASPPPSWPESERQEWQAKMPFMRIRVARCIKTWVDQYWISEVDDEVLPQLQKLVDQPLPKDVDISLNNIFVSIRGLVHSELARARRNGSRPMDRTKAAAIHLLPQIGMREAAPIGDMPTPIVKRTVHSRLGAMDTETPITDLEALEVARQLTLMEAKLYGEIPAQELVELGKQGAKSVHVKAISTFSTAITGWVSESILNEQDGKKRSALLKYFIKLADRCVGLHNYSTMRSILAALDSSTISRLTKTWAHLSTKYKVQLDAMRTLTDHAKNYAIYRETLRATQPPAVPFLGLYLTDLTFCREGNPNTRPSPLDPNRPLINFNKYYRLARIVQDVQRFQLVPYHLHPVTEIQKYLAHVIESPKSTGDLHDLYRRSLILEPRQATDAAPPDTKSGLLGWATRS